MLTKVETVQHIEEDNSQYGFLEFHQLEDDLYTGQNTLPF